MTIELHETTGEDVWGRSLALVSDIEDVIQKHSPTGIQLLVVHTALECMRQKMAAHFCELPTELQEEFRKQAFRMNFIVEQAIAEGDLVLLPKAPAPQSGSGKA